jgi:drug/metabolite transporter (DMT)-like permease
LWEHRQFFRTNWALILLLGATGYNLNSISVYEAVRYTTTINTSFINAFNPVLIAVTGYLMYRYPVTRVQCLGFLISLLGVTCIIFKGELARILGLRINIGDLFMLGSIAAWSVHTVVYKKNVARLPGGGMFPLMMLGGLLLTLPPALAESVAAHWSWVGRLHFEQLAGILALNIFPSVLAYLFWNQALTRIPANKVAIFQYLIPVYTTIISVLFLGERLQFFHLLGGAMIFVGVLLVTNPRLNSWKFFKHRADSKPTS